MLSKTTNKKLVFERSEGYYIKQAKIKDDKLDAVVTMFYRVMKDNDLLDKYSPELELKLKSFK